MKYAIHIPADQTIMYLCEYYIDENNVIHLCDDINLFDTIDHKEAKLWDTKQEAERYIKVRTLLSEEKRNEYYLEEVADEKEFRSREDTW